jgi:hypothetical protein
MSRECEPPGTQLALPSLATEDRSAGEVLMQRWRICLGAAAAAVLIAGGAAALEIVDPKGRGPIQAPTDLAAEETWDERGVSALGGEVGPGAPEVEGVVPTVVPEPTTLVLVSLGMVGLVFAGRRRI